MAQGDLLGAVMQSDIGAAGAAGVANWDATTPRIGKGIQLMDNGYFIGGGTAGAFPINQRGYTITTVQYRNTYFIDRWYYRYNASPSVDSDGIRSNLVDTTNSVPLAQILQDIPAGTYTLSFLVNEFQSGTLQYSSWGYKLQVAYTADGETWINIKGNAIKGVGLETLLCNIPVPAKAVEIALSFEGVANNSIIKVSAAKFELGDTQTLAHQVNGNWVLNDPPPNYQQELAKCQRYFQVFRTQALRPTYGIDFRPPMAADTPTLGSFVKDTVTYYTASAEL